MVTPKLRPHRKTRVISTPGVDRNLDTFRPVFFAFGNAVGEVAAKREGVPGTEGLDVVWS